MFQVALLAGWLGAAQAAQAAPEAPDPFVGRPANCGIPEDKRPEERPYNGFDDDCNPETHDDDLDFDGLSKADDCNDQDGRGGTLVDGDLFWPHQSGVCEGEDPLPLVLRGDLIVAPEASSLAGLSCLCAVRGDLVVSENEQLVDLQGLESLERVGARSS